MPCLMARHALFLLLAVAACGWEQTMVHASIYPVRSQDSSPPFQHAEKMFASNHGPMLARSGTSSITVDVVGENVTAAMNGWRLVVLVYHVERDTTIAEIADDVKMLVCFDDDQAAQLMELPGVSSMEKQVFHVQNERVAASVTYDVDEAGWMNTQIFVCSDLSGAASMMPFKGTMVTRHAFGFLPGVIYRMLPISGAAAVVYLGLFAVVVVRLIKDRHRIVPLHYGSFFALLVSTASTAAWWYGFHDMNETGEPMRRPYPTPFLVAIVLNALMHAVSNLFCLVVFRGYGLSRDSFHRHEVVLMTLLAVAYFVSNVRDVLTRGVHSGFESRDGPTLLSYVDGYCSLVMRGWAFVSKQPRGSTKAAVCSSLMNWLTVYALIVTQVCSMAIHTYASAPDSDVGTGWDWPQLVGWPMGNFIIAWKIWRPAQSIKPSQLQHRD